MTSLQSVVNTIIQNALKFYYWVLPASCLLCGYTLKDSSLICHHCLQDLPSLPQHCYQCAQFLHSETFHNQLLCGTCVQSPPSFDMTFALFSYEFPIISMIRRLKFHQELIYAHLLGHLLINKIKTTWYKDRLLPDIIIPVPLHIKRLKERGFNQALEIAKPIARYFSLPIDQAGLNRIKSTAAQSNLPASERAKNVQSAFDTQKDYHGLSIALIDDVITTGHTVEACCQVLKLHGAKRIDVWCCARRG